MVTGKAGARGPTLLEDFHVREKIPRFDHERIPERAVHARGSAAHGVFQPYPAAARYSRAKFLSDSSVKTPVFVRFSTVVGSRGAADTARDVRGFAVKFYTSEGNYDLVGNNIPVFFIQDGIKFPDLIHAVKPEPHNEIPQGASAHDTSWDFASLVPETAHMLMWVMSDRAIPRSFRMMEGFGVHTFRLIDAQGKARFVKFHWKPMLGVHALVWDEAQKIAGKDSDFHRRDLWEAIESGAFPEWELGVQVIEESDEHAFDFDLLDATKLVPEELVPVERIGKMTLNRNPDNYFAETEQVAFCPANIVPGIDFTNDPLLEARLFSYLDTQLRGEGRRRERARDQREPAHDGLGAVRRGLRARRQGERRGAARGRRLHPLHQRGLPALQGHRRDERRGGPPHGLVDEGRAGPRLGRARRRARRGHRARNGARRRRHEGLHPGRRRAPALGSRPGRGRSSVSRARLVYA
jgi:catalase